MFLTRKFFLPIILNLNQIFNGVSQWRNKAKFKILAVDFETESYKIILNNCSGFTEMTLYPLFSKVKMQHTLRYQSFREQDCI